MRVRPARMTSTLFCEPGPERAVRVPVQWWDEPTCCYFTEPAIMGHNRAGDGAKLKKRRRLKEEARLARKAEQSQSGSDAKAKKTKGATS